MFSLLVVAALYAGYSASNIPQNLTWNDDYTKAQSLVRTTHKPMAVFLGNGESGWKSIVKESVVSALATRLLSDRFVCVFVDTSTPAGRAFAAALEVSAHGLVISDSTGKSQSYSLSGTLTGTELENTLAKYSSEDRDVRATESVVRETPIPKPVVVSYPSYAPSFRSGST